MGVPAFFRWLSQKFPRIIVDVVEQEVVIDGVRVPVDSSQPNPNNMEFDNLYLDMNNIIHPCAHPEDRPAPETEDAMMEAIFEYIDRIFDIVRPRQLLYMAIDGVAPRAKMNQQRSRRFRAAKEAEEKQQREAEIRQQLIEQGLPLPDKEDKPHFDSNVITPGTPFMFRVAECLRYYVAERINTNPGWQNVKVIISDAAVPGEGEHKIMEFIRLQRLQPTYNPNTRHVIYGLDADLIMLALATHEPHFSILREQVLTNNNNNCRTCGQPGHYASECKGAARVKQGENDDKPTPKKPYQFLHVPVLREYLQRELHPGNLMFEYNFERVIDDWVFICFFVGNDFLPHLPSLKIREGAVDLLMQKYKTLLPSLGGYLTENGDVDLRRVEALLEELAQLEDGILRRRREREMRQRDARKRRRQRDRDDTVYAVTVDDVAESGTGQALATRLDADEIGGDGEGGAHRVHCLGQTESSNHHAAKKLKQSLHGDVAATATASASASASSSDANADADDGAPLVDIVRLGEEGWKQRYYSQKFGVDEHDVAFRREIRKSYVEGLVWVMRYYYQGCCSWKWFYPYHYAPFACDLVNLGELDLTFELGTPFRPFEQLMGVFPAASGHALPKEFHALMTDPSSPIIDFYPENFDVDMDGCQQAWQGVALLPFIDERRLLDAIEPLENRLTGELLHRNSHGDARLLMHAAHRGAPASPTLDEAVPLDPAASGGLHGTVKLAPEAVPIGSRFPSPIKYLQPIPQNQVLVLKYFNPMRQPDQSFKWGLLPTVVLPPSRLSDDDHRPRRQGNNDAAQRFISHGTNQYQQHQQYQHHQQHQQYPNARPYYAAPFARGGGGSGGAMSQPAYGDARGGGYDSGRGGRRGGYEAPAPSYDGGYGYRGRDMPPAATRGGSYGAPVAPLPPQPIADPYGTAAAFGRGSQQPSYGAPDGYAYPPPQQPQYGAGGYQQPQYGAGGYQQPQYGAGGYQQPQYGAGGYQQPQYGAGGYQAPSQPQHQQQQGGYYQPRSHHRGGHRGGGGHHGHR